MYSDYFMEVSWEYNGKRGYSWDLKFIWFLNGFDGIFYR
jgi:hypothetical protein